MYNKQQVEKINDKKILHKVKKHWVTVSIALLGLISSGTVISSNNVKASVNTNNNTNVQVNNAKTSNTNVSIHNENTNNVSQTHSMNAQPNTQESNIIKRASNLHNQIIRNANINNIKNNVSNKTSNDVKSQYNNASVITSKSNANNSRQVTSSNNNYLSSLSSKSPRFKANLGAMHYSQSASAISDINKGLNKFSSEAKSLSNSMSASSSNSASYKSFSASVSASKSTSAIVGNLRNNMEKTFQDKQNVSKDISTDTYMYNKLNSYYVRSENGTASPSVLSSLVQKDRSIESAESSANSSYNKDEDSVNSLRAKLHNSSHYSSVNHQLIPTITDIVKYIDGNKVVNTQKIMGKQGYIFSDSQLDIPKNYVLESNEPSILFGDKGSTVTLPISEEKHLITNDVWGNVAYSLYTYPNDSHSTNKDVDEINKNNILHLDFSPLNNVGELGPGHSRYNGPDDPGDIYNILKQYKTQIQQDHDLNSDYVTEVDFYPGVSLNPNSSYLFSNLRNLTISGTQNINASTAIDMNHMFANDGSNSNISDSDGDSYSSSDQSVIPKNIGNWNTSNVTNMSYMFSNDSNNDVIPTDIGNWDTSHVTNMNHMFSGVTIYHLSFKHWNTHNVKDMRGIFSDSAIDEQPTTLIMGDNSIFYPSDQLKVGDSDSSDTDAWVNANTHKALITLSNNEPHPGKWNLGSDQMPDYESHEQPSDSSQSSGGQQSNNSQGNPQGNNNASTPSGSQSGSGSQSTAPSDNNSDTLLNVVQHIQNSPSDLIYKYVTSSYVQDKVDPLINNNYNDSDNTCHTVELPSKVFNIVSDVQDGLQHLINFKSNHPWLFRLMEAGSISASVVASFCTGGSLVPALASVMSVIDDIGGITETIEALNGVAKVLEDFNGVQISCDSNGYFLMQGQRLIKITDDVQDYLVSKALGSGLLEKVLNFVSDGNNPIVEILRTITNSADGIDSIDYYGIHDL